MLVFPSPFSNAILQNAQKQGDGNPTVLELDHKLCVSPGVTQTICWLFSIFLIFHNFICPCSRVFLCHIVGDNAVFNNNGTFHYPQKSEFTTSWPATQSETPPEVGTFVQKVRRTSATQTLQFNMEISQYICTDSSRYHSKYYRTLHKI